MQTVIICLLIISVIPIALALLTIPVRIQQFGKPDLQNPREQATQLSGIGQRLSCAQANAWEALILFGASLLAATMAEVDPNQLFIPCYAFVAARVLHPIFYIVNQGVLRFVAFIAAFFSCMSIFTLALNAL